MSLLDRAKEVAGQAATRAKEEFEDAQLRRELSQAYAELGKITYELVNAGEITHARFDPPVARIKTLQEELEPSTP
jgi:hypothetical protein